MQGGARVTVTVCARPGEDSNGRKQGDGHPALPSWQLVAGTSPLPSLRVKSSRNWHTGGGV